MYVTCRDYREVAEAIRSMVIRGAPAIGVAAAMGVALGVLRGDARVRRDLRHAGRARAPPPSTCSGPSTACGGSTTACAGSRLTRSARAWSRRPSAIRLEDIAINQAIGRHGADLVPEGKTVLTHCNAGALATAGYGTALGVIRAAVAAGKDIDVFADETRPFLQGARLTAWEFMQDGIPTTIITDNMAGHFLKSGRIGCVIVGADRIAANGDVANKIGTYWVAVLARENGVPFYVAAPISTLGPQPRPPATRSPSSSVHRSK